MTCQGDLHKPAQQIVIMMIILTIWALWVWQLDVGCMSVRTVNYAKGYTHSLLLTLLIKTELLRILDHIISVRNSKDIMSVWKAFNVVDAEKEVHLILHTVLHYLRISDENYTLLVKWTVTFSCFCWVGYSITRDIRDHFSRSCLASGRLISMQTGVTSKADTVMVRFHDEDGREMAHSTTYRQERQDMTSNSNNLM